MQLFMAYNAMILNFLLVDTILLCTLTQALRSDHQYYDMGQILASLRWARLGEHVMMEMIYLTLASLMSTLTQSQVSYMAVCTCSAFFENDHTWGI